MDSIQITPEEVNSLLSKAKNWISAQEGHASGGRLPPGLTEEHINALRALQIIRKPELSESREPSFEENWIGKLLEYHQKNLPEPAPKFTESSVMSANQLRFRCSVIISGRTFPREEDYPDGVNEAPAFARKKDARRWAAKCAVEWLLSHNHNKHKLSPESPLKEKQAKLQKIERPEADHDGYRTIFPGDGPPGEPSSFAPQAFVSPAFVSTAFFPPAPGHSVTISAGAGQQEEEKKSDTNTEPILAQKTAQSPAKSNPGPTPPHSPSQMAGDGTPAKSNPGPTPPHSPSRMAGDDAPVGDQFKLNSGSWWARDPTPTKGNPSTPAKKNHPTLNKSVSSPAVIDIPDPDPESSPTRRVDMACRKLGLPPPRYCIFNAESENPTSNLFNGFASWPPEAGMPVRVGDVKEIYTRKGCKDLVAENILITLKGIELNRARVAAQVLGD